MQFPSPKLVNEIKHHIQSHLKTVIKRNIDKQFNLKQIFFKGQNVRKYKLRIL